MLSNTNYLHTFSHRHPNKLTLISYKAYNFADHLQNLGKFNATFQQYLMQDEDSKFILQELLLKTVIGGQET